MRKIGVYLGMEPYGGGAFQYDQSILSALKSLPEEEYKVVAFYEKDLWKEYLSAFPFFTKKVYTRRQLFDVPGALIWKAALHGLCDLAVFQGILTKVSKFSKQFDDENLDLIIFPAQEMLAAVVKTKSISVIHDLMHRYEKFPEAASPEQIRGRDFSYTNMCKASNMIFVDSEVGKQQVIECYGDKYADKIEVMPFTPPQYLFNEQEDKLPDDVTLPEKFIFYPAQFWAHKNHKNLILAVKKLKEKGIDIQLIFVGSKKNGYEEAMNLIHEKGLDENIHVLGYVSDSLMRILYRRARAMVMPSFFGPTNIPPLEGMAMGCPVAVSRVYAMPWQVGEAGLTFDPKSVDEIATTLEKLWTDDDLRKQMAEKGKERATYFSQERFNERFQKAIAKALESR